MSAVVTAVVPTRDRFAVLETTLRSIRAQSVPVAVVVVDEASSDRTTERLEALGDPDLTVVRNDEPRGVATARNIGLAQVRTPWVAFCDDDDVWAPDKVAAQLAAVEATGARWSVGGAVLVDEDLHVLDHQPAIDGAVLGDVLAMNVVPGGGSGVLADTAFVREAGGFDDGLRNSEDWDLWIRLAQRSPIAGVDRPLVGYRIWAGSKSRNLERMVRAWDAITERYAELAAEHGVVPDLLRHRTYLARQQVRGGRRLAAAKTYGRLAIEQRDARSGVRAGAALLAPSLMDRKGTARATERVPPSWRRDAEQWLAPLRRPQSLAAGGR